MISLVVGSGCTERPQVESPPRLDVNQRPPNASRSCDELSADEIFQRRILPLVQEGASPSCARCHLPGVDFRPFIKADECQTLACMEEERIIDLQTPEESKVLSWIARGHEVLNRSLEEDPLVLAEHNAFAAWISYQAQCNAELCEADLINPCEKLSATNPDITDDMGLTEAVDLDQTLEPDMEPPPPCTEDDIHYQFRRDVWPLHGRCYHCHSDTYSARSTQDPRPAAWMSDDREREGAREAVIRMMQSGYLNLDDPRQSLILLKPLSEEAGGLWHGGGTKMRDTEDPLYVPLYAWIEHIKTCREIPERDSGIEPPRDMD